MHRNSLERRKKYNKTSEQRKMILKHYCAKKKKELSFPLLQRVLCVLSCWTRGNNRRFFGCFPFFLFYSFSNLNIITLCTFFFSFLLFSSNFSFVNTKKNRFYKPNSYTHKWVHVLFYASSKFETCLKNGLILIKTMVFRLVWLISGTIWFQL